MIQYSWPVSLIRHFPTQNPNRLNSLYGVGKAAERPGDEKKAIYYYKQLSVTADVANSGRQDLVGLKNFFGKALMFHLIHGSVREPGCKKTYQVFQNLVGFIHVKNQTKNSISFFNVTEKAILFIVRACSKIKPVWINTCCSGGRKRNCPKPINHNRHPRLTWAGMLR